MLNHEIITKLGIAFMESIYNFCMRRNCISHNFIHSKGFGAVTAEAFSDILTNTNHQLIISKFHNLIVEKFIIGEQFDCVFVIKSLLEKKMRFF